jgi:type IV secretory pathway component VirB8
MEVIPLLKIGKYLVRDNEQKNVHVCDIVPSGLLSYKAWAVVHYLTTAFSDALEVIMAASTRHFLFYLFSSIVCKSNRLWI